MTRRLAGIPDWRSARQHAERDGWHLAGSGDWSWVYRSPHGGNAWRISPFDPAFRYFADVCLDAVNPHLPSINAIVDHPGGGQSVLMEWLEPIAEPPARAWLDTFRFERQGPAAAARALLEDAAGRADLPLFAGLDLNPANVLQRPSDGSFVLTDAFWVDGRSLYEMVMANPAAALAHYDHDALADWAHIPAMDPDATQRILRAIGR